MIQIKQLGKFQIQVLFILFEITFAAMMILWFLLLLPPIFAVSSEDTTSDLPNFKLLVAKTRFEYALLKDGDIEIAEKFLVASDDILMAGISPNFFIGTAQIRYRYVEYPYEQM